MHSFELVPGFALKIEYVIDETELLMLEKKQRQKIFMSFEKSEAQVAASKISENPYQIYKGKLSQIVSKIVKIMENLGRRQLLYHFSRNSEIIFVFGLFVISIARSRL